MSFETSQERPLAGVRDPGIDRALRQSLREQARHDTDPLRREMTAEVLAGRVTLREAALSRSYGDLFAARADDFVTWWQGLSERERGELATRGRGELARLRVEAAEAAGREGRR